MCSCGGRKNNNRIINPPRQIMSSPNRNMAPPQQQQMAQPPKNFIAPIEMTPDRRKIERLQREAIRKSLGK